MLGEYPDIPTEVCEAIKAQHQLQQHLLIQPHIIAEAAKLYEGWTRT